MTFTIRMGLERKIQTVSLLTRCYCCCCYVPDAYTAVCSSLKIRKQTNNSYAHSVRSRRGLQSSSAPGPVTFPTPLSYFLELLLIRLFVPPHRRCRRRPVGAVSCPCLRSGVIRVMAKPMRGGKKIVLKNEIPKKLI